jgi:hypothetical protein
MSWKCKRCSAVVSDNITNCPLCEALVTHTTCGIEDATSDTVIEEPSEERDSEGYTKAERMKRRPMRETANAHLLQAKKQRARWNKRKIKPFSDAVVPGSVRTSRPLFSTIRYGRNR